MTPNKTCPVVLRKKDGRAEILVFRHPKGDVQLVKGTIEPGEDAASAAIRELGEESGILSGRVAKHLGIWESGYNSQIWAIFLCEVSDRDTLSDGWDFYCDDDGGIDIKLFWHTLDAEPGDDWHPVYQEALAHIRNSLKDL